MIDSRNRLLISGRNQPACRIHAPASLQVLLALLALCLGAPSARGQTLGEQVNDAIKAGVAFLRTKQLDDGHIGGGKNSGYPDGETALALLALVKSGVPQSDPAVEKALEILRYMPHTRTYSTAVRIMALDALRNEKYSPAIRAAAEWLVENFRTDANHWGYPQGAPDLSNTQYAVLGLWTAERHGFEAPRELWAGLTARIVQHQNPDGGFGYHERGESRGSMTTAGITVLTLCRERIPKALARKLEVEQVLERAWENLERRFHPAGNPVGEHAFFNSYYYYYLYGLERACAIGDRRRLGDRDWYKECAAHLVAVQNDDGSWGGVPDTCFALLFLRLSTYTTIRGKADVDVSGAGTAKKSKLAPAAGIPFVKGWLFLGPFDDAKEAAFGEDLIGEGGIDPRKGSTDRGKRWVEHCARSNFVDMQDVFSECDHMVGYAFCRLRVREDGDGTLWFGSDDGARIWLDGNLVHDNHFRVSEGPDRHAIPVKLDKGTHRLLVKVADHVGKWGFYLRFSRSDGSPLTGLVPFTGASGPSPSEFLEYQAPLLEWAELFELLPLDRRQRLSFDSAEDAERVLILGQKADRAWKWLSRHDDDEKFMTQDGARGILFVQPRDRETPVRVLRKVKVSGKRCRLLARLAACHPELCENADFAARLGVFDGAELTWFWQEVVTAGTKDAPAGWREITADLGEYAGGEVLTILECAAGGPHSDWKNEYAFVDEFSVR